ncbi:MAG: hypothetical protein JW768_00175 [Chitinispirillaceae bacterium]|nr:hypothetical protein [Chitinispirillaceae bacterium]
MKTHLALALASALFADSAGTNGRIVGVSVSCGFALANADLERLSQGLDQRLSAYGSYGLSPRFMFPDRMTGYLFRGEVSFWKRFSGYCSLTSLYDRGRGEYTGTYTNQEDGQICATSLSLDYSLTASPVEIGAGYRFVHGYCKNLIIEAGAAVLNTSVNVMYLFKDSMDSIENEGDGKEYGYLVLPVASVAYVLPINHWLEGGIRVKGRLQVHSAELEHHVQKGTWVAFQGERAFPNLRFDFGGVEANLFVAFRLR